ATVPGAPTLTAATPGNTTMALSWNAPAFNGGSPITTYTATASPGGASCTTVGLSCNIVGLTNGTSYSFTVTAANAGGTGPASNGLNGTPATVPGAPTITSAVPGNAAITVSWTAPSSNGGAPITSYTVTTSPGSASCTTSGLSCTVSGLTNGTLYTVSVA